MKYPPVIILAVFAVIAGNSASAQEFSSARFWPVQSVDTMKYSRDIAREKLNDRSFDSVIDAQIKAISATGASHISIGTPYDEEFNPYLRRWVKIARNYGLKVWFRGNFSGWEGWFGYPKISRSEHKQKVKEFITRNRDIFEDGDIFTACPECENGGPGDPRHNGDLKGHREFLIQEYDVMDDAFDQIGHEVIFNYNSMNGDVAHLVMDQKTTAALGGVVAVDHYVKTKEKLVADIKRYARDSGGKVVLAEFGAPIPDIHGPMSEIDQAKWIQDSFKELIKLPELIGINYWVNIGGSTQLWDASIKPRAGTGVLRNFYMPDVIAGYIKDELDRPIKDVEVGDGYRTVQSNNFGYFEMPYYQFAGTKLSFSKENFTTTTVEPSQSSTSYMIVNLEQSNKSLWFRILQLFRFIASFGGFLNSN